MRNPDYKFMGCGVVPADPNWAMPPHCHPFHEVIVVKSGSMLLKTRHGELDARAGDVLFYEAGLMHEEISQPANPVHTCFLAFRSGQLLPPFPLRMRDSEGRMAELVSWLIRDRWQGRPVSGCQPLLHAIVGELQWMLSRPRDAWEEHIRNFFRLHLAEPISLGDVARYADMSRFAFVRKFKRITGSTPMQELRQIRLYEARNLILSRNLGMKAVARAVGIGDEYQLSKLFRRFFGVSPGQMRNRPVKA